MACLGQTLQPVGRNAAVSWRAEHDVRIAEPFQNSLKIRLAGNDPYVVCTIFLAPNAKRLWVDVDLKSDQDGQAQLFYATKKEEFSESRSVRFDVKRFARQQVPLSFPRLSDEMRL